MIGYGRYGFSWSPTQEELYQNTLSFAREHLNRGLEKRLHQRRFPDEEWHRCAAFGLLGLCVPEAYSGLGLDSLTTARVFEALGRGCGDTGLCFSIAAHLFAGVMPIVEHGQPDLKERLLPALCSGQLIAANAITEAAAGSDVFALETRAERVEHHYVLNGIKSYVTNGPIADVMIVYATVNPAYGFMGVTAFVVERNAPGITRGTPFMTMGLTTSPICSVQFDHCEVPMTSRLGAEGQGGSIFASSMQWERSCLFGIYLGVMERNLEQVIAYANQRTQFGKSIGKHQAIAHRIADMKLRLESARLLLYHSCWLRDRGERAPLAVSLAKLAVSEAAIQSGLDAILIHGGAGVISETGVEATLRDAIPAAIFSGTSEMQRDIIARELGL